MGHGLVLFALSFLGGDSPQNAEPMPVCCLGTEPKACSSVVGTKFAANFATELPQTSYDVRLIHMPAATWRSRVYANCTRLDRQGISTVWALDKQTVTDLELCLTSMHADLVSSPRITALDRDSAVISMKTPKQYVGEIDRVVKTRDGKVEAVAFRPVVETIDDAVSIKCGIDRSTPIPTLSIDLSSSWIGALNVAATVETYENSKYGKGLIAAQMQLPQIVEAKVRGDFKVPDDCQLLISLGTCSLIDKQGKAIVIERLALIAARHIVMESEEPKGFKVATNAAILGATVVPEVLELLGVIQPPTPKTNGRSGPTVVSSGPARLVPPPSSYWSVKTMSNVEVPSKGLLLAKEKLLRVLAGHCGSDSDCPEDFLNSLATAHGLSPAPAAVTSLPMGFGSLVPPYTKVIGRQGRDIYISTASPQLPTPPLPSRSPVATADSVSLPPLPDDQLKTTSRHTVPAPRPSLQSVEQPIKGVETANTPSLSQAMRFDPNVAPARFEPVPVAASSLSVKTYTFNPGLQPQVIRIPVGGNRVIEIQATVK